MATTPRGLRAAQQRAEDLNGSVKLPSPKKSTGFKLPSLTTKQEPSLMTDKTLYGRVSVARQMSARRGMLAPVGPPVRRHDSRPCTAYVTRVPPSSMCTHCATPVLADGEPHSQVEQIPS